MKNFKEIAEKCLAGELKGTFKNRKGENISSEALCRYSSETYPYAYYHSHWACVNIHGDFFRSGKPSKYDIIDFIPDNMQEQIKIDIPEGKVPVMEQTEKGVVITWKEKRLTYDGIINEIASSPKHIIGFSYGAVNDTTSSSPFYRKVEALRKLTNIRNYFGKPSNESGTCGWVIRNDGAVCGIVAGYPHLPVFAKKEHAEQAVKILGDELKYLFESW